MRLGAALIVKNEEAVLSRCLASLFELDEIVVHDTGSTDRTKEIALAAGARVVEGPRREPFHFADARNFALNSSTCDWVFSIDADEVLRPGGAGALRHAIQWKGRMGLRATFLQRVRLGDPPIRYMRLMALRRGVWAWRWRIHEEPFTVLKNPKIVDVPNCVVEHLPDPAKRQGRSDQNLALLEQAATEERDHVRLFWNLGHEYMARQRWADALVAFEKYGERTRDGIFDRSEALCMEGFALEALDRPDEALSRYEKAGRVAPRRREPFYRAAAMLWRRGNPGESAKWLRRCVAIPKSEKPDYPFNIAAAWTNTPAQELASLEAETRQEALP